MEKSVKNTIFAAISTLILYGILFAWGNSQDSTNEQSVLIYNIYSNAQLVFWSGFATVAFFGLVKAFDIKQITGKIWLILSIGLMGFFLGDCFWGYYQAILLIESPFPSLADYFYSIAYILFVLGLFLQTRLSKIKLPDKEKLLILVIEVLFIGIGGTFVIYPIIIEPLTEVFTIDQQFFSLFYPILDLIVALETLVLVFKYRGGDFSKGWLIIALGFIVTTVADLWFSWWEWNELSQIWNPVDFLFVGYSMLFTIGAIYLKTSLK